MTDVSFLDASLWGITFSDACDLSSIVLPREGHYRLYSGWKNRLEHLAKIVEAWSEAERYEATIFVRSHLVHAVKQNWYLINCDKIIHDYPGAIGTKIIEGLGQPDRLTLSAARIN